MRDLVICDKDFGHGVRVEIATEERTIGWIELSRPLMAILQVAVTPNVPAGELIKYQENRIVSIRNAIAYQDTCNQEIAVKRVAGTLVWTAE
jgi:hypothetical protein